MKDRKEIREEFIENITSKPLYTSKIKKNFDLKIKIQSIYNYNFKKNLKSNDIRLLEIKLQASCVEKFLQSKFIRIKQYQQTLQLSWIALSRMYFLFNLDLPEIKLAELDFEDEDYC